VSWSAADLAAIMQPGTPKAPQHAARHGQTTHLVHGVDGAVGVRDAAAGAVERDLLARLVGTSEVGVKLLAHAVDLRAVRLPALHVGGRRQRRRGCGRGRGSSSRAGTRWRRTLDGGQAVRVRVSKKQRYTSITAT